VRAINVGFACNNACSFCAQGELRARRPAAAEGEVARAIEAIVASETVAFVGGEPTLFPELPAWLRAATARGAAAVVVQTNGRRLAYHAYARELREASPVVRLDVSLQGSTPVMHDWHTGAPGSFAQTMLGLRHAHGEGIPTGITVVVTRANYRHLGEIVRLARTSGASAIQIALAPVQPFGRALGQKSLLVPAPEMVAPHLQRASAEAARLKLRVQVGDRAVVSQALTLELFAGIGDVEAPTPAGERLEVDPT
jgi:MoaA/NifB/PqqE/SkfB family radical SAM enzyme